MHQINVSQGELSYRRLGGRTDAELLREQNSNYIEQDLFCFKDILIRFYVMMTIVSSLSL